MIKGLREWAGRRARRMCRTVRKWRGLCVGCGNPRKHARDRVYVWPEHCHMCNKGFMHGLNYGMSLRRAESIRSSDGPS